MEKRGSRKTSSLSTCTISPKMCWGRQTDRPQRRRFLKTTVLTEPWARSESHAVKALHTQGLEELQLMRRHSACKHAKAQLFCELTHFSNANACQCRMFLFRRLRKCMLVSPNVGLEPTTRRLRVSCSTGWASQTAFTLQLLLPGSPHYPAKSKEKKVWWSVKSIIMSGIW